MTNATLIRLCPRCGRPLAEHDVSQPADLDPVVWDAYVAGACSVDERDRRLQIAVDRGVSISRMLEAQKARQR